MVSDEHYEICLPVLEDSSLDDENKTDKLLELLKAETTLAGTTLENAILDVLWRYREGGTSSASPPPIRQTILRRPSPASWRSTATPLSSSPRLGVSPLAPLGYVPTPLNRTKSSTASPFSSPRPSPRLNFATPVIPHSPNLNAYEFANDTTPAQEILGEYPTENVDWLVNDDGGASLTASYAMPSGLNAAAPEFSSSASAQQTDMTPYDMLRTILGQSRTDDEIETALAAHGFDLSATVVSIMDNQARGVNPLTGSPEEPKKILVGRSATPQPRPSTPVNPDQKSGIICKFYLSSGQCLRSDCRFSHDLSSHLCKYWMMGNCLAGDTCVFSHDPAQLVANLTLDGSRTPLRIAPICSFKTIARSLAFTVLARMDIPPSRGVLILGSRNRQVSAPSMVETADLDHVPEVDISQRIKLPLSTTTKLSLLSVRESQMAPSPSPSPRGDKRPGRNGSTGSKTGENSAAAQAIPSPKLIPWLETGERANKAYLKARQEAIKHGGLRNKFLQSAAQAWNRNDARAAKALSLRGQSENDLMRKAHREAARELYEQRNKLNPSEFPEIYVDLHGLHPEEAVGYLEKALLENSQESRPVYAITGTGNHSKNGKDKVGKAVRNFLNEWRYAFREFSVPGDKNNMGGILGIDARSWDKSVAREGVPVSVGAPVGQKEESGILSQGVEIGDGKVKLLVREPPKGPSGSRRLMS